ncbi:MAG: PIN domain-containing protein [Burkholderiaceae bacterium]|nr:PIN domain-containing protein [Burkholderiaceae bacterium]
MSGVLRPWLLTLAEQGLFQPIWSDRIGSEWRRNAARIWNIEPAVLEREWHDMQMRFDSANVSRWSNAQDEMPALKYSDAKDWHVIHSAWLARQVNAEKPTGIVTINIKDFSRSELRRLGLDLWEPDRLLSKWWEISPDLLRTTLQGVIQDLIDNERRHPAALEDFLKRERLFRLNRLLTTQRP